MESSVILVRCPQMMLLKQCIRRAVQEGLIHPSGHAFFSSFPIQSIICNARPFDVPCSFWSCCTWWPEHRCGGGDQTESWTDTCPGWLECSVNKQLLLYQDWRHSRVQDVAAMEMISPSSSASEMEPVKDPNQCWLILWKRVRSV